MKITHRYMCEQISRGISNMYLHHQTSYVQTGPVRTDMVARILPPGRTWTLFDFIVWTMIIIGDQKGVPSAVSSHTMRGLGEVISGRSFPHTVQCVEATARTCDLSVHRRQALPLASGCQQVTRFQICPKKQVILSYLESACECKN